MDSGAANRKGIPQVGFDGGVPLPEPRVSLQNGEAVSERDGCLNNWQSSRVVPRRINLSPLGTRGFFNCRMEIIQRCIIQH